MEKALEIIGLNKVYRNNVRALENINLSSHHWLELHPVMFMF